MDDAVNVAGSLRARLALTLIGSAAAIAILLFFVVRTYAAQIAQSGQDSILEASVASILDAATLRDGDVEVDFPYVAFSMLSTDADDRVFYAIWQEETLLSGYELLPVADAPDGGEIVHVSAIFDGAPVRVATAARILVGANTRTRVTVSVAQTQDALAGTLNKISRNVGLIGAGFFTLSVLVASWATNSTIRPLERLTHSITRRGPKDLSPVARPVPLEMAPLVTSLNSFMARLDTSLKQSEDFIAEAAHRVRTPLATVRSHAEATLQRVEREDNRQALRSMVRAIDESSRAAGQLLDHAMITFRADHLETRTLDLVELVEDLVTRLAPVAEMKDIALTVISEGAVSVEADSILLQNALRNLVENALKYAPEESEITLEVGASPRPRVEVRDEGPGFPPDQMQGLAVRFSRGDNAKDTIGSGLGLTIAQDVATAHGGELTLGNMPEGGACVTFLL
ncbi:sensor histidine kinase N-terminal domain-containing protein [Shimia sp.]|jgi:two-component system sensor histidine kinase TctE|uniref:sensor histidine kinase n=1 Tax=unclassified Shimia TaxID=2630038 RepID=UPI0025E1EFAC|nr:sensor histidine kinase N-terminal domain-containing protein [Shimia sp.]MCH2067222.1 sensor histidine kinase N-terminal domain-containing protein [Shimia sp.]